MIEGSLGDFLEQDCTMDEVEGILMGGYDLMQLLCIGGFLNLEGDFIFRHGQLVALLCVEEIQRLVHD